MEKKIRPLDEALATHYGFKIKDKEEENKKKLDSFAPPESEDGAMITGYAAFHNNTYVDFLSQKTTDEVKLIEKYREMSISPECEKAIDDIINEMVVFDFGDPTIILKLDNIDFLSKKVKEKVSDEFQHVLELLNFHKNGYDIIRKWYVDGRLYYHLMIDKNDPKAGIQDLRYIDPRKIRKVKEYKEEDKKARAPFVSPLYKDYDEYYVYTEDGITPKGGQTGLKISKDSVAYAHSGIVDFKSGIILSHLHKAIKPFNQLRMLEDATIIYRIARAPERRLFYIDVGGLSPHVAERYMSSVVQRFKNKLSYDVSTGEVMNERRYMTMLEDFFLPQRDNGNTQVDTLPGGQNLGEMEDVEYFRRKMYESLNVPTSRLEDQNTFNIGRPSEITRDEVKFSNFVKRLRRRFADLFEQILEKQVLLKNIVTLDEWRKIRHNLSFDFHKDNHFSEMRNQELLTSRLTLLRDIADYATPEGGAYFSKYWIKKNALNMSDEEINEIKKQVDKEKKKAEEEGENPDAGSSFGMSYGQEPEPEPSAFGQGPSSQDAEGDQGPEMEKEPEVDSEEPPKSKKNKKTNK